MPQLEPYIPYKGNKFQILDDIYTTIRSLAVPDIDTIVDPFCGGGSFSYFMAQHGYKVLANDLDSSVIELHKALQLWGNSNDFETLNEWTKRSFTKAQFKAMLDDDSAFGGFVRSIWSFGNDGRTYLTSDEKEAQKLEDFAAGTAEPNSRAKHILDIALAYTRQKLDISFTNLSYEQVKIPENALVYCFSPDHEVLTSRGWKSIKDVTTDDWLLSREPNTSKIAWVKNTRCIKKYYSGKMYEYDSSRVSLCVSPEHNLFVKTHKEQFIKAEDAQSRYFDWIKAGGIWSTDNTNTSFCLFGKEYNKVFFAELLGIFLTDGAVNNQKGVTISQTKPHIKNRIRFLLNELKVPFSERKNSFYIKSPFSRYFWPFYKKENRCVPAEFLEENTDVLKALLKGITQGDGSVEKNGRTRIYTGSKPLADNIIEIAYKVGLAANIYTMPPKKGKLKDGRVICGTKNYYCVSVLKSLTAKRVKKHERFIDYNGYIYCCTLEKWHTVLVRRKGKTVWCGQCDPPYSGTAGYRSGDFDTEAFHQWALNLPNLCLISEYEMPEPFVLVAEYPKWVESGRGARTKMGVERLYANKPVQKLTLF